ncbi:MAG TPA: hypothetical protein VFX98_00485 [Longimicrobiaceae bacterium]|nr:hypothetical protein [Longimicrobiaceae bacterium]
MATPKNAKSTGKSTPPPPPPRKKKKRSMEEMHRTVQEQVQALPYAVDHFEKEGKRGKAFMIKYVSGPILKLVNRVMSRTRYKGAEGAKLKQSEQMKRHLEQRRKAMEYVQGELRKAQKKAAKRTKPR